MWLFTSQISSHTLNTAGPWSHRQRHDVHRKTTRGTRNKRAAQQKAQRAPAAELSVLHVHDCQIKKMKIKKKKAGQFWEPAQWSWYCRTFCPCKNLLLFKTAGSSAGEQHVPAAAHCSSSRVVSLPTPFLDTCPCDWGTHFLTLLFLYFLYFKTLTTIFYSIWLPPSPQHPSPLSPCLLHLSSCVCDLWVTL